MINIQNVQDFACQCLNRDVWSNEAVKTIIREHFIFWQVCLFSSQGWSPCFPNSKWAFSALLEAALNCLFHFKKHSHLEVLRYWNKTHLIQYHQVLHLELHFISWQVYHDSEEGQRYIQFYKLNKFPYISILDPRTGECCPHFKCLISVQCF